MMYLFIWTALAALLVYADANIACASETEIGIGWTHYANGPEKWTLFSNQCQTLAISDYEGGDGSCPKIIHWPSGYNTDCNSGSPKRVETPDGIYGNCYSNSWRWDVWSRRARVVSCGRDNKGSTSILYCCQKIEQGQGASTNTHAESDDPSITNTGADTYADTDLDTNFGENTDAGIEG